MTDSSFSFQKLLRKLKSIKGFDLLIEKAILLYIVFDDEDTPAWVKAVVLAALVYLINPMDAVPDTIPVAGYADDLATIVAAIASIKAHIHPHHYRDTQSTFNAI